MGAIAAGLFLVPLVDQGLKLVLRQWLRARSIPLGPLGTVRMVRAQIWMSRLGGRPNMAVIWTLWLLAAGALAVLGVVAPSRGWFAGLLLGGSLSHMLETSLQGSVSDYVCLRFWPAFNLADVAITVGAIGVALGMLMTICS